MKRMTTLLLVLTIAGVMFSTVQPAVAATVEYFFTFNESVKPFQPIAYPPDTTVESQTLTLNTNCYQGDGLDNRCAQLFNNRGALFVAMLTQFKANRVLVNVEFIARDLSNCARCAIIVYSGSIKPNGIGGFQKVGPVLTRYWQYYQYQAVLALNNPVVAVGILNLDETKEKQMAGIDNLRVTLTDK